MPVRVHRSWKLPGDSAQNLDLRPGTPLRIPPAIMPTDSAGNFFPPLLTR